MTTCLAGLAGLVSSFALPESRAAPLAPSSAAPREALAPVLAELDASFALPEGSPSDRASTLQIARRVSLALTGTVPSIEEIEALERRAASQGEEQALAWWVDTRLADRRYADYFAERFARALVGTDEGSLILYRRRRFVAWLADQLAADRPWDAITTEMIAGEGLWTQNPATNFVTAGISGEGSDPDPELLAGRFARVFLAQRLDCAQCHDHPFDARWSQRDFQALAAFFAPAELSLRGLQDGAQRHTYNTPGMDVGMGMGMGESGRVSIDPAVPFAAERLPDEGPVRARLAAWLVDPQNPALARATVNRVWTLMFGLPLVDPLDDIPFGEQPSPALELLAEDFVASGYDLRRLVRVIAMSEAFTRASRSAPSEPPFASFPLTRLRPEQVAGAVLQAAKLRTLDHESHVLTRIARALQTRDFIERYGDAGEDELVAEGGTIPQRLLLLNGELVDERTRDALVANAATRIAVLAPTDARAVELAYLAVLTRRPSAPEAAHFEARLEGLRGEPRRQALADLYWVLLNSTESAWNH